MATALDTAAYIVRSLQSDGSKEVITRKAQKLTYYAQAWNLVWTGRPLYQDAIEAWKDGPVVRRVYAAHYRTWAVSEIPGGNPARLTDDERSVVDDVLRFYGRFEFDELVRRTHDELPWQNARKGLSAGAHSTNEINERDMRSFYAKASVLGQDVPARTVTDIDTASAELALEGADKSIEIWQEALAYLASR